MTPRAGIFGAFAFAEKPIESDTRFQFPKKRS